MISLKKDNKGKIEVYSASMNDIMFFLMLFFLIMSTLLNPSAIKVNLPNAKNSTKTQQSEIQLTVTTDHKYYIDNRQVLYSQIESILKEKNIQKPNSVVMLRFDSTLSVQRLVGIMSIGNKIHSKMILVTSSGNSR